MLEKKAPNGVLVICEQSNDGIHRVAYELLHKGKEIAQSLNEPLECIVLGYKIQALSELSHRCADNIFVMDAKCFDKPEEVLYKKNLVKFIEDRRPNIILIGATEFGRSLAPRVACALKTGLTADCTDLIINDEKDFIQVRPAFSDNILAHIKTVTYPKICTVRYKEFDEADIDIEHKCKITNIEPYFTQVDHTTVSNIFKFNDKAISEADVIVAVGRGLRDKEDLNMFGVLADLLGGMVGASRAIVDAGLVPSSMQIGYSGNRVKPRIYIACGISGAPQHVAGMKESDIIIAINRDPSAPIFNIADYGFVGDFYEIIPMLIQRLRKRGF
ncbi:MAG: electron transfer flavoprotein subunit alpha/FixB family protein [Clostridiales bacterium]|nr:electron transfer flavoprotein subunit alpha/FixB family protein [Clostridiales bacterium]MDD7348018.1 electron transfer flavoprotein subunit alpha/FixB family protein [Clostridiales bacterium]MDY4060704.1 electron transfer flavoprotein subunit alpha/FixB family protein [Anaerovoracaceae bacterium]